LDIPRPCLHHLHPRGQIFPHICDFGHEYLLYLLL
jgi:hypothetical protein